MTRVLVVDDEEQLRRALDVNLAIREYEVLLAATGEQALELAATRAPDLVVLDLGLPGIDGIDVVRGLRGWSDVPILVLSARTDESDKIAALDAGADDYVTKPFGMGELLARLRALERRLGDGDAPPARVVGGGLDIDLADRRLRVDGTDVALTPTEWALLAVLATNVGRLVTRDLLVRKVWGDPDHHDPSLLRVHVGNLRRKLEVDPSNPHRLRTEPGMGYRFVLDDDAS